MSNHPLDALRAAAPAVPPPSKDAREAAYRSALAQPPLERPVPSLRRWWMAGGAAVTAAVVVVAGTAVPAVGQQDPIPEVTFSGQQSSTGSGKQLYVTHADGTVHTVAKTNTIVTNGELFTVADDGTLIPEEDS
ncbi:MAG: hypothetical protein AAGC49_13650 [Brevundimonas sp.]